MIRSKSFDTFKKLKRTIHMTDLKTPGLNVYSRGDIVTPPVDRPNFIFTKALCEEEVGNEY